MAPRGAGALWRLGLAVVALALASAGGRAQGTPTISIGNVVTVAEGNSGLTTMTFSVTIANANGVASSVSFTTADGTAVGGVTPRPFRNTLGPFVIPDGAGTPVRIPIMVSSVAGPLVSPSVVFERVAHQTPADIDVLLVSPDGRRLVIQSDAIGIPLNGSNSYVLKDGQPLLPANGVPGFNSPTSYDPLDVFGAPAPQGQHPEAAPGGAATLNDIYRGLVPNGIWELFVQDDTPGNQGTIGGVSLLLEIPETGTDFAPTSGVVRFLPGGPTTQTITVPIYGDTVVEPNETFTVNLSSPINAVISDGQAIGTITNDDGGGGGSPPTAVNDSYTTSLAGLREITRTAADGVLSNDQANGGGPMTVELVSGPAEGVLRLQPDGSFTYAYNGLDQFWSTSFTYRVTNGNATSNVARVSLTALEATRPYGPRVVAVLDDGVDRHVHVRFSPPLGSTPVQYALTGGTQPGETIAMLPTGSPFPVYKFSTSLTGSYFFRVHAFDGTNLGAPSTDVPLHLNENVPPSAPINLLSVVNGSDLALAWTNTYEGGIPRNTILRVTGDVNIDVPLGRTESSQFRGAPNGRYVLQVLNTNGSGASSVSNAAPITIPSVCTGPPLTPEDLLLAPIRLPPPGNVVLDLSFFVGGGPAPTSFKADVRSSSFNGEVPLPGRAVSAVVSPGLWQVRVAASNACGDSPWTPFQEALVQ